MKFAYKKLIIEHPSLAMYVANTVGFVLLVSILSTYYFIRFNHNVESSQIFKKELHAAVIQLEDVIKKPIYLSYGLVAKISEEGGISSSSFNYIVSNLLQETNYVKNFSLIEGDELIKVCPLEGNEAAIGIRFNSVKDKTFRQARETGETVISDLIELVQGGRGIIIRTPIFTTDGFYWGQLSVVIDWDMVVENMQFERILSGQEFKITKNTKQAGVVSNLYGASDISISDNSISEKIEFSNSSWVISANINNNLSWFYTLIVPLMIFVLVCLFTYMLFKYMSQIKYLSDSKVLAEELGESRRKLLISTTHDLRQPISALGIAVEQLIETPSSELKLQVQSCLRSVNLFFDELQGYELLESNKIKANYTCVEMDELISDVSSQIKLFAVQKQLNFTVHVEEKNVTVQTDELLLQRILRNLLINAVENTSAGSVELKVVNDAACLVIEIIDTGCGIPESEINNIIKPFYQLNLNKQRISTGLGVGLDIVSRLCYLLDIDFKISSQPASGTRVVLSIPLISSKPRSPVNNSFYLQGLEEVKCFQLNDVLIPDSMLDLFKRWGIDVVDSPIKNNVLLMDNKKTFKLYMLDAEMSPDLEKMFVGEVPVIVVSTQKNDKNYRKGNVWYIGANISPALLRSTINKAIKREVE